MNLQASIRRILREETNKTGHGQRIERLQKLLDDTLELMLKTCRELNSEDDEHISFDVCDFLELEPKIRITNIEKKNVLNIYLKIEYSSNWFVDEDPLVYELQWNLRKFIPKVNVILDNTINTMSDKDRQW
jgi:hypothetical protein